MYIGIFCIIGCILLALFQNVGRLSHNEKPKSLLMPQYFVSIYEDQKNTKFPRTQDDYEGLLHDSPLYKKLLKEITIQGGSKGCDPSDPNVICPPGEIYKDDAKASMSLTFDPIRTEARLQMSDSWRGRVHYDTPQNSTHLRMSKAISNTSELNFEYNQKQSTGKVSFELNW